jgi:hypothetical protein
MINNKTSLPCIDLKSKEEESESERYIFLLFRDKKKQTPEIALAVVSKNGYMLQHVKNQTPEIAFAAVSENGFALSDSKFQTNEIILAAWNQAGDNLLNFSVEKKLNDVITVLLQNNVFVGHVSEEFKLTPFQIAVKYRQLNTMIQLFQHGADIHIKTQDNQRNALAELIYKTDTKNSMLITPIIGALLEMGISPLEPDSKGKTALMLAKDKPEILAVLKAFNLKKLIQSKILESSTANSKQSQKF